MSPAIFSLGDSALCIAFGDRISETVHREIISRYRQLLREPLPGMIEAIPAYTSLSITYDILRVRALAGKGSAFSFMKERVEQWLAGELPLEEESSRLLRVPVLYDGPDLARLAEQKGLSVEQVIALHSRKQYRVYMLGFLPGFAYMGELEKELYTERKPEPKPVRAGAVAVAGMQTGIYPMDSPGGWTIIGRTSLALFDKENRSTLFQPGDLVRFDPVTTLTELHEPL